ncbi:sulfate ABC transporter substrate-binding protein [Candidatus Binatia bacterium]|nr:sulfate ABC transporter substrate-binding protein [Candidatus Binatia bacterium]
MLATVLLAGPSAPAAAASEQKLLNASYDVSREFYKDLNASLIADWKAKNGTAIEIEQSHNGSSKQARAVIDGLEADVVTLNQVNDIGQLVKAGLVAPDWQKKFPYDASAYKSVTAFIVRKGNPKNIRDWQDLVRDDVKIALVNPKTGGNGRYTFLAAYGWALNEYGGDEAKAKEFVKKLYANVPVLDTGGRAATTTFAQRGIGDVLVTFEAEVYLVRQEFGADGYEVVVPSRTILADFPFAIIEPVVDKHGTRTLAEAYLRYIVSDEGQEIAAKNFYRPNSKAVAEKYAAQFAKVDLIDVQQLFGGWSKAQQTFFDDGGVFDQIYTLAK